MTLVKDSEFMRIRNIKNAKEIVNNSKYVVNDFDNYKYNLNKLFKNNNPIHLEIGMGKGQFIMKMAKKYPNINFIGVERYDSIVARAVKKLEDSNLNNVRIIIMDALNLGDYISHEIDTIYLNFSDPWPKKRQAKRRLTSQVFLNIYDDLFKNKKRIVMKTDNKGLFASSIVSLSNYGYVFKNVSLDLANSDIENETTEYEEKFMNKNEFINYLEAEKD